MAKARLLYSPLPADEAVARVPCTSRRSDYEFGLRHTRGSSPLNARSKRGSRLILISCNEADAASA